jgi:L-alanine-DL-glutamate epimerase-like enolase superfamily enzyme
VKITKIDIHPISIPYIPERVFTVSYGAIDSVMNVIVKIHTDEGIVGLGEAAPVFPFNGESQESCMAFLSRFAPKLIGMNPMALTSILELLDTVYGNLAAKTAIDFALYDIIGKATNQPIYNLLGGLRKDKVPIHMTVPIKTPKEMAQEATKRVEEGFRTIEMKLGRVGAAVDADLEVERIKSVRDAVGSGVLLIADANTGWAPHTAISIIRKIEQYDVFIEQPTKGIAGLAEVKRSVSAAIVADESCSTPEDTVEILRRDAADMISVKPAKMGGLYKTSRIIAIAESAGLPYRYDGMESTRLTCTASLHMAMATAKDVAGGFSQYTRQQKDIVKKGGLILEKGVASVQDLDAPGIGVELDDSFLGTPVTFS